MILLIGLLSTLLILSITKPFQFQKSKVNAQLAEMYSLETAKTLQELDHAKLEYQLISAGISLSPLTFRFLCFGISAGVLAATWLFLPGLPALLLAAISGYLPFYFLKEQIKNRANAIEKVMPVAVGRIASGLLAGGGLPQVLEETAHSLNVEGNNPLSPELLLTTAELNAKSRHEALSNLAKRSPSPSLSNLAFLLESYLESGGGKYSEVLLSSADRIQQILMARNRAAAKAGDALLSARVIPGVLVLVIFSLSSDPLIRHSLQALPIQILLAITIVSMVGGFLIMRSMISEVA
jgi:pilus assembly protein TadC